MTAGPADRAALARAFVAKAVFNLPTTRTLIEHSQGDRTLRRLCGWSGPAQPPRRRGRTRQREISPRREPSRLERQRPTSLDAMLDDLPRPCDISIEHDAKGHRTPWTGTTADPSATSRSSPSTRVAGPVCRETVITITGPDDDSS